MHHKMVDYPIARANGDRGHGASRLPTAEGRLADPMLAPNFGRQNPGLLFLRGDPLV